MRLCDIFQQQLETETSKPSRLSLALEGPLDPGEVDLGCGSVENPFNSSVGHGPSDIEGREDVMIIDWVCPMLSYYL